MASSWAIEGSVLLLRGSSSRAAQNPTLQSRLRLLLRQIKGFPGIGIALGFLVKRKHDDVNEEDGIDEDALEAFFSQLEKDLNIDLSDNDCDEELSEEDLARLGKELEEAFADEDEETFNSSDSEVDDDDNDDDEDDDEDDERPIKLKNWQLRRLASALKIGRRKTSIKSLAAELCLDRALVLELLRDPPPNLLLLSAALPDKVEPTNLELETEIVEPSPPEEVASTEEPEPEMNEPIHVMQRRWSMQKRLKKVQVETLERVYKRSKRPTNAMISSIVHVTNLPRKRIVQWFEEKRAEEGVPENRRPYHGSKSDTVFTNKSL
ncbi:hypothetical protein Syun_011068 [Stephania yunnanensis]|uniref:Homeobox domain-containing protein n=1 Tax=Stephania yunnanensis TaxID=152371 RepID=A0AAP0PE38_9MAGN